MSLKTLLGAGRSFLGMNGRKHRYKVSTGKVAPAFGMTPSWPAGELNQTEANAMKGTGETKNPAKPETAAAAMARKQRSFLAWPWFSWSNPFSRATKAEKKLIQAELRLGKVEPLRNDLSDSDLMVVTKAKGELVKKRMWLAQSLLEHNRTELFRTEESGKEAQGDPENQSSRKPSLSLEKK